MPDPPNPLRPARGVVLLLIGTVVVALVPTSVGQSKPLPAPPASQPAKVEIVAAAVQRLRKTPVEKLSRKELALRAGLEFCLALGKPDGTRCADLLDVVGYQALPPKGELPEKPDKPIDRKTLEERISRRAPARVGDISVECFKLVDRQELRASFPAVARWMLAQDFALLIEPPDAETANWVSRPCCLVVRLRTRKATIIGGNLLAALEQQND